MADYRRSASRTRSHGETKVAREQRMQFEYSKRTAPVELADEIVVVAAACTCRDLARPHYHGGEGFCTWLRMTSEEFAQRYDVVGGYAVAKGKR